MSSQPPQSPELLTMAHETLSSPKFQRILAKYKKHYKKGYVRTLETGCLIFTTWIIYYLIFLSSREMESLDVVVTIFFMLGAIAYLATTSVFKKLSATYENNLLVTFLKSANKYIFMTLSFLPGLYFAFQYDTFILRFYLLIHLITSAYFFYKRFSELHWEPFIIGILMSLVLGIITPTIHFIFGIFGSSWLVTSLSSLTETIIDTGLAVAFMLRLPEKHLPPSMLFGLKLVKQLMFILSWRTFFILMVFTTWKNLGTGAEIGIKIYNEVEKEILIKKPKENEGGPSDKKNDN